MDQPKIERLLRLMKMLTANNKYTVEDLSDKLNMSIRTIYRYVDTFRDAGFAIKKNNGYIKLDRKSPYFKDISQLIHFTDEEAYILKSAIESIDETNLIKQNLKAKLYSVYDYKVLAECVVKGSNAHNVNALIEAIENKKQVILHNYTSAHSKKISDRIIEPFSFTTNYIQLWAYDTETISPTINANKLFKISRIESVEILEKKWEHERKHLQGYIDLFRITGYTQMPVKLQLGIRAASLLIEEFPLAEKELKKISEEYWILATNVCSYEGIGRFVLGLLDDITVIESNDFKTFLRKRISLAQF
ncbi:MAG: WYL domain-containing protein [Bacteroidales bacterium]